MSIVFSEKENIEIIKKDEDIELVENNIVEKINTPTGNNGKVKRPMGKTAYILLSLTIAGFGYLILLIIMLITSFFYYTNTLSFYDSFNWFIDNVLRYKIILIIFFAVSEIIGITILLLQFFFKIGTTIGIIGIILSIIYIITRIFLAIIIGFLNQILYTVILSSIGTVIIVGTVLLIIIIRGCKIRYLIYEISKLKGFIQFGLALLSLIIIIAALPFEQYRAPPFLLLIISVVLLTFLLAIVVDDMFNDKSALSRRSNVIETSLYLTMLSTNILFGTIVLPVSVGLTSWGNPSIIANLPLSKKVKSKK